MNIYKILRRQKEIKKDKNKGIPVRINPDSLVAKEIEYQTCLLKEVQEDIQSITTLIGIAIRNQDNEKNSSSNEFATLKKKLDILMKIPSLNKFLLECLSNGEISVNDMRNLNDLPPLDDILTTNKFDKL